MPFEILHFRGSDKILKDKNLDNDVRATMEYIGDVLDGTLHRGELLRQALKDMKWRENGNEYLRILEGRRYMWKAWKRDVAIEANLNFYEYILDGLFRLQLGYAQGKLESGILLLTAKRSEKSPYGSSSNMVKEEIEMLYPTISLPVSIVLFDLGEPVILDEEGGDKSGIPVSTDEK
jgi:hypothetical protein